MSCSNLYPNNKQIAEKNISIQLGETSNLEIDYINSYIKDLEQEIQLTDNHFKDLNSYSDESIYNSLENESKDGYALSICAIKKDGSIFVTDKKFEKTLQNIDYTKVFEDGNYISDAHFDNDGVGYIVILESIKNNEKIVGAFGEIYSIADLMKFNKTTIFRGQGFMEIIQPDGIFIKKFKGHSPISEKNKFEEIKDAKYIGNYSFEKIITDIKNGKTGLTKYSYSGETIYAMYSAIGINDWYLITSLPEGVILSVAKNVGAKPIYPLSNDILLVLIVILILGYFYSRTITKIKKQNNTTLANERRFKEIISTSASLVIDVEYKNYDFDIISGKNMINFIKVSKEENLKDNWRNFVNPDDLGNSEIIREKVLNGINQVNFELRLRGLSEDTNEYHWYSLSAYPIFDENNNAIKATIIIKNIEEERERINILQHRAERDSMTGMLNRATIEAEIDGILNKFDKKTIGVLLMFDIDNFKQINDENGHIAGDKAIQSFAKELRRQFIETDTIGRIGGDEFLVWIKDVSDKNTIETKVKILNDSLFKLYNKGLIELNISVSAGATVAELGDTFENVYGRADSALYKAKETGKCKCVIYTSKEY